MHEIGTKINAGSEKIELEKYSGDKKGDIGLVLDRTESEELQVLRRVMTKAHKKVSKHDAVRVEARMKGIKPDGTVTLVLQEIPPPDTAFAKDIAALVDVALRHAHERCERLGYKKVLGVRCDGKQWEAKLEL